MFSQAPPMMAPGAPPTALPPMPAPRSALVQAMMSQPVHPMQFASYSGPGGPSLDSLQKAADYFKNNQGNDPTNANGGSTGGGTPSMLDQIGNALPKGLGWGNSYAPGSGIGGTTIFGTPWADYTGPGGGQSTQPL